MKDFARKGAYSLVAAEIEASGADGIMRIGTSWVCLDRHGNAWRRDSLLDLVDALLRWGSDGPISRHLDENPGAQFRPEGEPISRKGANAEKDGK